MPARRDRLKTYRGKREFERTPEPAGGVPQADGDGTGARFVVQEHDATRLHWDLRLEHGGVLASWALPRFFPGAPGENHLAVRTEDHPLEYLEFSGEIPRGSYGGGTMRIYDAGTYETLKWDARKVEIELHGERLRGRWALFALARSGEDPGPQWMIHRMGGPVDPDAEPMPAVPVPMLARAGSMPAGSGWGFEVKWDGVRAICRSEPGRMTFTSRNGNDVTEGYPDLARLNRALHEHRAILDGEIIAFEPGSDPPRPSFQALQRRMHVRDKRRVRRVAEEVPATYVVFDLLWLDGHSLMHLPYAERRERLRELDLHGERCQVPEEVVGHGEELLAATERLGLEGVVAKRLDAPYEPGRRSAAWIKVKRRRSTELVIGGWLPGEGSRSGRIGSLLVGEPDADARLRYAGRVGSGLSDAELDDLRVRLGTLASDTSPFVPDPQRPKAIPPREARWVRPELLAEVAFTERSADGLLRHPVWVGLREDLPSPLVLEDERAVRGRGVTATAVVGDRLIPVTNLDKELYPGVPKRAVLEYYAAIAPVLTGHLAGRALTLKRYPDGAAGQMFYEKRVPGHAPDWVHTAEVRHGSEQIRFVVADEPATVVWLAQLAALELHPSLALAVEPDRPTVVAFDLDPGAPATIVECCRVALLLRGMLEGVGLQCGAKTSGSKGMQVYAPLNRPEVTFDATKAFARAVAEVLAQAEPDLVVATQAKARRRGRVLVDWAQNDRAKTTVAVYSLRAVGEPRVSTPVTWDEVQACADGAQPLVFGPFDVLARVDQEGDLFADVLTLSQPLPAM